MKPLVDEIKIISSRPQQGISWEIMDDLIHLYKIILAFAGELQKASDITKKNLLSETRTESPISLIESHGSSIFLSSLPVDVHSHWSKFLEDKVKDDKVSAVHYANIFINYALVDEHFFLELDQKIRTQINRFSDLFEHQLKSLTYCQFGESKKSEITFQLESFNNLNSWMSRFFPGDEKKSHSQKAIISGELSRGVGKLILKTSNGQVQVFAAAELFHQLLKHTGPFVIAEGDLEFDEKYSPVNFSISKFSVAGEDDRFFNHIPEPLQKPSPSIEQLYEELNYKPNEADFVGKWPGDESWEELVEMLREDN